MELNSISLFVFLTLNSFFLGLEEVLELLLTHTLSRIVLVLFISQNSERIWRVVHFLVEKHAKKYLEFPANMKIARIILFWLHLRVFQGWGLDSWSFYYVACAPMQSETWRHTPCHADAWLGFDNIMQSYALIFCGVEHSSLLGLSVSVTGWAVWSHSVFMWLFSQDCNCAGYAAIGSVNWSVPWLTPI